MAAKKKEDILAMLYYPITQKRIQGKEKKKKKIVFTINKSVD